MNKRDKKKVKVGTQLKCVKDLWKVHYDKKIGRFRLFKKDTIYKVSSLYDGKYHITEIDQHHGWGHHSLDHFELAL